VKIIAAKFRRAQESRSEKMFLNFLEATVNWATYRLGLGLSETSKSRLPFPMLQQAR
jgi:hypothetical protein